MRQDESGSTLLRGLCRDCADRHSNHLPHSPQHPDLSLRHPGHRRQSPEYYLRILSTNPGLLKGIIVSHQEVKFDSFREIADSPLNIFINRNYIRYLPKDSPETLRIGIDDMIYSCIQKLKTRSVICLTSQIYAEYLTEIQLENDGSR